MKKASSKKMTFEVFLERLKPVMSLVFDRARKMTSVLACVCIPAFLSLALAAHIDLIDYFGFSFYGFLVYLLFLCFGVFLFLIAVVLFLYIFISFEAEYKLLDEHNKFFAINISFWVFGSTSIVLLIVAAILQSVSTIEIFL